jgi:predicted RNase H-like nuclease (RuvC/YqgF family)
MEKVTKIIAILVLVISVGFLFFAAKTIDRIQMQKNLIASLHENISSLQNTINSLTETVNLARDEITSLRTLAEQLKQEIAKAKADKEKAEKALAEAQNENRKLNAELKAAKERITVLTAQTEKMQQEGLIVPEGTTLDTMITELARKLKETENKLSVAKDQLATLESLGIILERESTILSGDGTPQIVKETEGKIVDVKPNGIVSINFKGSIKPQKGATFYIIDANQVKAKLALEEVYNTILVAHMGIEKQDYNIKSGDNVKLILWTE